MHSAKLNLRSRKQEFHRFFGRSLVYFQRVRSYLLEVTPGSAGLRQKPDASRSPPADAATLGLGLVLNRNLNSVYRVCNFK
jgi:hypothetical protein